MNRKIFTSEVLCCLSLFVALLVTSISAAEPLGPDWQKRVDQALKNGQSELALDIVNRAVAANPSKSEVYVSRGMTFFRLGRIEESLTDFDKSIKLNPDSKPYCWQRGISLYYLGKYAQGRDLFSIHQSVNPSDVENAFWHYLCVSKLESPDAARKQLLRCGFDQRIPLMDIYSLLAGKKTIDDVLAVIESASTDPSKTDPSKKSQARFYGFLYLGLYLDATGEREKGIEYLQKSLAEENHGYMSDVAKVHLEHLQKTTVSPVTNLEK